jgi:3-oxoacyl-[acyl-carrier-protein] synthase-1
MREPEAKRRRLEPLARILGIGTGRERARPDNDAPAFEALGLTTAVEQAAAPLRKSGRTAGWMLTDLTSEMRRLYEWQSVFVRAQKVLGRPYIIESPAQRIGYLGAAAMPLFVVMAATGWEHGYSPSDTALAVAGTDGGERLAMALESARPKQERTEGP